MFLLKYNFHLFFPLPTFTPPKSDWPKCYSKPNLAEFIENKLRITATTYMKCSRIFDLCSLQYRLFTFSNSYPVPSPPPTPDPLKKKKTTGTNRKGKWYLHWVTGFRRVPLKETLREPFDDKGVFAFLPSFLQLNLPDRKHICLIKTRINQVTADFLAFKVEPHFSKLAICGLS